MNEKRTIEDVKWLIGDSRWDDIISDILACVPEDMEMIPYQSNEDDLHTSAHNAALAKVRRNLKEYLGVK